MIGNHIKIIRGSLARKELYVWGSNALFNSNDTHDPPSKLAKPHLEVQIVHVNWGVSVFQD